MLDVEVPFKVRRARRLDTRFAEYVPAYDGLIWHDSTLLKSTRFSQLADMALEAETSHRLVALFTTVGATEFILEFVTTMITIDMLALTEIGGNANGAKASSAFNFLRAEYNRLIKTNAQLNDLFRHYETIDETLSLCSVYANASNHGDKATVDRLEKSVRTYSHKVQLCYSRMKQFIDSLHGKDQTDLWFLILIDAMMMPHPNLRRQYLECDRRFEFFMAVAERGFGRMPLESLREFWLEKGRKRGFEVIPGSVTFDAHDLFLHSFPKHRFSKSYKESIYQNHGCILKSIASHQRLHSAGKSGPRDRYPNLAIVKDGGLWKMVPLPVDNSLSEAWIDHAKSVMIRDAILEGSHWCGKDDCSLDKLMKILRRMGILRVVA